MTTPWRQGVPGWIPVLIAAVLCGSASAASLTEGPGALRALLSRSGDEEILLFSPNDHVDGLFLPLRREGRGGGLTVVAPSRRPFTRENLAAWRAYVATIASGADNSFLLRDGALEGSLEGMRVRIVPIGIWGDPPAKGAVVLDLSFLLSLYLDEGRTPFVELPVKFVAALEDRGLDLSRVILWLRDREDLPLERGYLPRLAAAVLSDPGAFRGTFPRKWQALRLGEQFAYFGKYEPAIGNFEEYLKDVPEDPSVLLKIAYLHFVDQEYDRGLRFLNRAYRSDPYYIRGYSGAALSLYQKGNFEPAERVLRAGLHQAPDFMDMKLGLGKVLLAQARKMLPGDPAAAEARFAEVNAIGLPDEVLEQMRDEWERVKSSNRAAPPPMPGMPPGHMGGH